MAYAISIGKAPEMIWMLQNALCEHFVSIVLERCDPGDQVRDTLAMSVLVHGIALDVLFSEQPEAARRLAGLIAVAARSVADGACTITDEPEDPPRTRAHFRLLAEMLGGWPELHQTRPA